jgi:hypothetical protein
MKTRILVIFAIVSAAVIFMSAGCQEKKVVDPLGITWGNKPDSIFANDSIVIPFTVSNVEKQAITATAMTASNGFTAKASAVDENGNGTVSIKAPGVLIGAETVYVSLSVTDAKNERSASSHLSFFTETSQMFWFKFKTAYFDDSWDSSVSVTKDNNKIEFVVCGLGGAIPSAKTLTTPGVSHSNVTFTKGASGSDPITGLVFPSDGYTGSFTVDYQTATNPTTIYLAIEDNYGRWMDQKVNLYFK